jgi:hypothetical protein
MMISTPANTAQYAAATARIDQSSSFIKDRMQDGGQALRRLFADSALYGVPIPGTTAAKRLRFVLFYMSGQDGLTAPHRVQPCWNKKFSQHGLHPMLRDGAGLNQVGRFCTAISVGFWARGPLDRAIRYSAAIGHEVLRSRADLIGLLDTSIVTPAPRAAEG